MQLAGQHWSTDFVDGDGTEEVIMAADETSRFNVKPAVHLGYRCLFYRTN